MDFDFSRIANALCPWSDDYNRTRSLIGDSGINTCWTLADGYGSHTFAQLREKELTRDWSHIRDSSSAALQRIWNYLRDNKVV